MQAEPAHMNLSSFDWISVVVVAVVVWWALRHLLQLRAKSDNDRVVAERKADDERSARFLKQQESLEGTVRELIKVVSDLKAWVALEFVRQKDYDRDIDRLRGDLKDQDERFQLEMKNHRGECPVRREG